MNAIHVERVNLSAGPMCGLTVPALAGQTKWQTVDGDIVHVYGRVGETRVFFYEGASLCSEQNRQELSIASISEISRSRSFTRRKQNRISRLLKSLRFALSRISLTN